MLGGVEVFVNDLISTVDQNKFDLILITDSATRVTFRGKVIQIDLPRLRDNWMQTITAGMRLAKAIHDADVVMTTTARMHLVGAVAATLARKPLIWRMCDVTLPRRLARLFSPVPKIFLPVTHFIANTCSPDLKRTIVIPDGVRDEGAISNEERREARRHFGFNDDQIIALMLARLVRAKGCDVFAQAIRQCDDRVIGLIVGGDDESDGLLGGRGLRQELERFGSRVRLLGHRDDVRRLFAASDLYVNASVFPEGMGRALMEAQMAGLPLIASDIGGIPEIIGDTGILIPPHDTKALAQAMMIDATARKNFGEAGRRRALENFQLASVARRFEKVWHEAAGV
ncbi:MAG: glycosyltransferase family 4 protein [Chloroflexi bacterium]|nr:glycosyltransferase family 4 protein [Chloroflexota bacterium]